MITKIKEGKSVTSKTRKLEGYSDGTVSIRELQRAYSYLGDLVDEMEDLGVRSIEASSNTYGMTEYYLGFRGGFIDLNNLEKYLSSYEDSVDVDDEEDYEYEEESRKFERKGKKLREFRMSDVRSDFYDMLSWYDNKVETVPRDKIDTSHYIIFTNPNDVEDFKFRSDYWGNSQEYKDEVVEFMYNLRPFIGKTYEENGDTYKISGLLLDKDYNNLRHCYVLLDRV